LDIYFGKIISYIVTDKYCINFDSGALGSYLAAQTFANAQKLTSFAVPAAQQASIFRERVFHKSLKFFRRSVLMSSLLHSSLSLLLILSIRYLLSKFCHRSIRSRCASATKTYPFVRFSLESCGKNPLIVRPNSISFSKMCQQSAKLFSFKVFKVNLPLPSSDPQDTWKIYSSHSCETLTGFSKTHLPSLSRNRIRQWSNAGTMKWKKH
jgi:hypothetical protein